MVISRPMENPPDDFQVLESQSKLPRNAKRAREGFNRMDVVNAFNNAFHIMGGVSRLALWANQNPDKFYPLYARLMPSTSLTINTEGQRLIIEHSIPSSPLDDFSSLMSHTPIEDAPIKQESLNADKD